MRCTHCQAVVPESAQWCGQCFAAVAAASPVPQAPPGWAPQAISEPMTALPYVEPPASAYAAPTYAASTYAPTSSPAYAPPTPPAFGTQPLYPQWAPPPPPVPIQARASSGGRRKMWLLLGAAAAVIGIAAWFAVPKAGPTLRMQTLSVQTPAGWSEASKLELDMFTRGMTGSMPYVSGLDVVGADDGDRMVALVSAQMPGDITADYLHTAFEAAANQQFQNASVYGVERTQVGPHAAVRIHMTANGGDATMVVIPDGQSLLMCMVATEDGTVASDEDLNWILDHLKTSAATT